jgi:hypothetical protein
MNWESFYIQIVFTQQTQVEKHLLAEHSITEMPGKRILYPSNNL